MGRRAVSLAVAIRFETAVSLFTKEPPGDQARAARTRSDGFASRCERAASDHQAAARDWLTALSDPEAVVAASGKSTELKKALGQSIFPAWHARKRKRTRRSESFFLFPS
jgi:hypothetical protein